ncbi:helix-turn-helix domain-containing protein [Ehrlichia ruminantium]|uniref:Helix-turn-helix domain-containing protein n=1 Tax=Ehrlichia ruminantium TaxID=779 RepID=A0AAE6QE11_EHRRU|nr:helix-turn-helix transcriptional regulator [Ehrlichia ruminantium]QGR02921.1 helix-turn-helix domain-containing protein [Ehrlichia ruminantium]QGR03845.1 helix-turn-helix domain-containing protein [Ehrlichia ruminantium]QGR04772.1 helix-turn-helix domain-containing protein [Ehrlichia ruminantium]
MSIHAKNKTNKLDYPNEMKAESPIFEGSITEDIQNNFNKENLESIAVQKSTTPKSRPHPVDECVGKEIKRQRIMRGMSQNQLANKLGITFQQVQKYEKGTNRIVISRLYQLASVLNVEVRDIMLKLQEDLKNISCGSDTAPIPNLKDNEEKFVPEFHDNKIDSKEVLMMVRAYTCIKNEKVRNIIYNLVKALSTDNKTSA